MNDIFKDMQANVGCEYISDLPSYKRKVWHEMKRLNPADYEERQLKICLRRIRNRQKLSKKVKLPTYKRLRKAVYLETDIMLWKL